MIAASNKAGLRVFRGGVFRFISVFPSREAGSFAPVDPDTTRIGHNKSDRR
jgi:hypothetical protein